MKPDFSQGGTLLDPDDMAGLIPSDIVTIGDLNAAEQKNIILARLWLAGKSTHSVLEEKFLRTLHKKMFGDVWRWAGQFRKTEKNLGVVSPHLIASETHKLLSDTKYWIENQTFSWDETGARFHHRLVQIHPFVNGNGRHARLATDLLLSQHKQPPFTWGMKKWGADLKSAAIARENYLVALRNADKRIYGDLIEFVRM